MSPASCGTSAATGARIPRRALTDEPAACTNRNLGHRRKHSDRTISALRVAPTRRAPGIVRPIWTNSLTTGTATTAKARPISKGAGPSNADGGSGAARGEAKLFECENGAASDAMRCGARGENRDARRRMEPVSKRPRVPTSPPRPGLPACARRGRACVRSAARGSGASAPLFARCGAWLPAFAHRTWIFVQSSSKIARGTCKIAGFRARFGEQRPGNPVRDQRIATGAARPCALPYHLVELPHCFLISIEVPISPAGARRIPPEKNAKLFLRAIAHQAIQRLLPHRGRRYTFDHTSPSALRTSARPGGRVTSHPPAPVPPQGPGEVDQRPPGTRISSISPASLPRHRARGQPRQTFATKSASHVLAAGIRHTAANPPFGRRRQRGWYESILFREVAGPSSADRDLPWPQTSSLRGSSGGPRAPASRHLTCRQHDGNPRTRAPPPVRPFIDSDPPKDAPAFPSPDLVLSRSLRALSCTESSRYTRSQEAESRRARHTPSLLERPPADNSQCSAMTETAASLRTPATGRQV